MKRKIMEQLILWKNDPERKPLILKGARQVGKTWIMKEFGKTQFENYIYCNFDEQVDIKSIFSNNKNPKRILELLTFIYMIPIVPGKTLLIFDEIQECPEALNTLKYFYEETNEYHIIAAGSLLGTLLSTPKSYPVGKVDLLNLEPMDFGEFLAAINPSLSAYYESITKEQSIENLFHGMLMEMFAYYEIIGGMPECVSLWQKYKDPQRVLKAQKNILEIYENDFSKHTGKINSGRILQVFRSIVSQLAKDNHKFIYGVVKAGGRAREFEEAIEWLVSAGLTNRVYNVNKIEHPLPAYDNLNAFKLYFFDTGLLKCLAGISNEAILLNQSYQFKGALSENYVLQQLKHQFDVGPRYYANANCELDFLLQNGMEILPVEIKSGNEKSAPSFKAYINKHNPKTAIRYSRLSYKKDGSITNLPLYLAAKTKELI